MYPTISLRETGINLRRSMDKRGIEAKDVQKLEEKKDCMLIIKEYLR